MKESRRSRSTVWVVAVLIGLIGALTLAACGDKSGPAASMPSTLGTKASSGPNDQHELVWKFKTGDEIRSSPTVAGGTVYVGSADGCLYAVDSATGKERWTFKTSKGICSSPALADGVVYVGGDDGYLYAIDATSGQQRWKSRTSNEGSAWRMGHLVALSSPTVAHGLVYVGSADGYLCAMDSATGEQRWRFKPVLVLGSPGPVLWRPSPPEVRRLPGLPVYSSPVVSGRLVYFHDSTGVLHALDSATGRWRWSFETGAELRSSPTVSRGVAYEGRYALDATSGKKIWSLGLANHMAIAAPAVADGVVYVRFMGWAHYLAALDGRSGREEWTFDTGGWGLEEDNMPVESSPAVHDGVVYVGSEDGRLYALDGRTGEEEWSFTPDKPVSSSPTVSDGVVYFGSYDGCLYAVKN